MSEVHVLPTPRAVAAAANANPRNASTVGIYDVAGRIGIAHHSERKICATLDAYIGSAGFPAPYPTLRAGTLSTHITRASRWPRVAVDAWFDDRLPPLARGRVDQAERATIDSTLSVRAAALFGDDAA